MSVAPAPLRTAIIGYGISGRLSHAEILQAHPRFHIAAICDTAAPLREAAQAAHHCAVYAELETMLATETLDLVSIVTRSDTHCPLACQCLRAGVPTIVTKPWALHAGEAREMMALSETTGTRLFPWIPMYWSSEFRQIQQLLADERVGKVFCLRRSYTDFRRRDDWQTQTRFGGGYLLNWGMHLVQPILALAGQTPERIFGQLRQTINGGDADDNFLAVLEFPDEVRGIIEFTESLVPMPSFVIQGTQGTIVAENNTVRLITQDPEDPDTRAETTYPLDGKPFGDEAAIYTDIARALQEGEHFPVTPEMALLGTRVLDAIRASHETGTLLDFAEAPAAYTSMTS